MKTTYQIRREPFGVALIAAESPKEALLLFLAQTVTGKYRTEVTVHEDGTAEVEYEGVTYTAVS